ncbi:MAG: DNA translocase FtsK [Rhizobiaceae bacterium]|nr:DNA translocase FtsK [Rhizobiaceae bacterium]
MQLSELETGRVNPTVREGLGTQLSVLIGLALLGLVGACFVSLASWNVLDPSFSYANGKEATNTLGYPGAVFADMTMQFLGLASAIALIPPAIWGWTKLMQRKIFAFKQRVFVWIVSILLATAFFACLQIPQSWPLPLGLGGVIGSFSLALPELVIGEVTGIFAVLFGTLFGVTTIGATLAASGLIWRLRDPYADGLSEEVIDTLVDHEDEPSWFLGAIGHYYYSAKMRYQSSKSKSADSMADPFADEPKPGFLARIKAFHSNMMKSDPDGLDEFSSEVIQNKSARVPQEPSMYADPVSAVSDFDGPDYGENTYNDFEQHAEADAAAEEWAPQEAPDAIVTASAPATQAASSRVQAMAPPPKPSARVQREAQPSLINMSDFDLPSLHYLQETPPANAEMQLSQEALEQNARLLEGVLEDFGVKGEIINVRPGPVVTLYELEPAPGIKSSRVIGLADDIARSMSAIAARVAVVPGRNAIGIELPNSKRETVYLREILSSKAYDSSKAKLPLILGKTIGGEATIADLAKMPHLLVAGTTGSGKSVAINTMILSILYRMTPEQVKLIMIDPKMLELSIYDGIPHLLTPVVTDPKKAVVALKWTVREMEDRYKKMSKVGVRNIDGFNSRIAESTKKGERITRTIQTGYDRDTGEAIYEVEELDLEPMPYIIVIIDEMADLMMVAGKDIEGTVQRLAQMARAAGIHVIMATQRPSVDVITGTIKANFPTRISFQVTSKIDSRTILGEQGAEQLLGMGDMLYMAGGGRIQRVHGPFVADDEVDQVVQHLKEQGVPQYLEAVTEETEEEAGAAAGGDAGGLAASNDIYDQAVAIVLKDRKVSTSYIQRRLSIGYNRAASLIERMEQEGLISAANHAGKREILVPGEDETI